MLLVISGPIASGKSTLARAVARELVAGGTSAAVVDLDLVYEMLDPSQAPKSDLETWAQARRTAARLAGALLAEVKGVVVEGEFVTEAQRAQFSEGLPDGVAPRFVTLSVSYDEALRRAGADKSRGISRDPTFLRDHYDAVSEASRGVPSTDLSLDTAALTVAEATRVVVAVFRNDARATASTHGGSGGRRRGC